MARDYSVVDASTIDTWSDEADVVVVGLGAAGSSAAIEAREAGADVLVLEKASGGGGLTASAAGHLYLGGGTRVQKAVGVEDSVEAMKGYLMAITPEPEEAKIDLYCEGSVDHFDWLVDKGVPFEDSYHREKNVVQMTTECLIESGNEEVWPYREKAKPAARGHKVAKEGEDGGAKLMECLIAHAEKLGVRIQCDTGVHTLVRDADGRIVGVGYRRFDDEGWVKARNGVILCAGQFGMNDELLARFGSKLADDRITKQGSTFDDGAGHQLGEAAGGELLHMEGALLTSPFYPPEKLIFGILVNKEGKRFIAEDSYHSRSSIACTDQPDGKAWLIVDEKCFDRPLFGWQEVVDAWETVEEMERDLGMPEGSLQQTMASYNEHAARGEDPEFHKKDKWLEPLTKAPFAAIDMSLGEAQYVGFPLGGLRVSVDGEVLTADGRVVPGLYAAGGDASNIAQDGLGYSSGTCIGEATFFGRRAGRKAAAS